VRILIAEDEPLARCALESKLTRWGYEVIAAEDGTQAWSRLQSPDAPRLAMFDWSMPGLSGIELTQKVRQRDDSEYVYIILLTGKTRTEDIVAGMDAGADDYVVKPFKSEELRARLRAAERILDLHEKVRREHLAREAARQRHLEEIQAQEARLRAILSSLHETIIVVHDRDGIIEHAWGDDKLDSRYGIDLRMTVGRRLSDVFVPKEPDRRAALSQEVLENGRPGRDEFLHRLPAGDFWHDVSLCLMRDASGEILSVVEFMQDVTERKRMQEELQQARRLESVGQLAAGIAHEINTPMQYTGDNTRFIQESFEDVSAVLGACQELLDNDWEGEALSEQIARMRAVFEKADVAYLLKETPQAIGQSLEGIEQVTRIVRAMKDFSHAGVTEKVAVDINASVESTITICRNEWKYLADVETDLDADLPQVLCLPGEMNQVLLNLIINAAHAIAGAAGEDSSATGIIRVSTRWDGDWVEIRVTDNGCGIPDEIKPRIFDPFFTTKDVGKGTGQGLTIARSIVTDKHGGTIDFESETGKGTTFVVRLPLDPTPAGAAEASDELVATRS